MTHAAMQQPSSTSQGGLQQAPQPLNGAAEAEVLPRPGEPEWLERLSKLADDAERNGLLDHVMLGACDSHSLKVPCTAFFCVYKQYICI